MDIPGINEDVQSFRPIQSDTSFEVDLQYIASRENKFNKMPMPEVIEIFSLMCCPDVRRDCPQITNADLVNFIRTAILKETMAGEIKRYPSFLRPMKM